jgi:hypothetical protein
MTAAAAAAAGVLDTSLTRVAGGITGSQAFALPAYSPAGQSDSQGMRLLIFSHNNICAWSVPDTGTRRITLYLSSCVKRQHCRDVTTRPGIAAL